MCAVVISTVGTSLLKYWKNRAKPGETESSDMLLDMLKESYQSCAEANTLSRLELDKNRDHLYFLGSDSDDCIVCIRILEQFYQQQGYLYVYGKTVAGLNSISHEFQQRGLSNLIKELSKIYDEHGEEEYIINATGGYKGQTAYATLFGFLTGSKVVYIHEDFKNLIIFPQMPVKFDTELIEQYKQLFSKVINAPSKKEAREILNTLPLSLQGFFEKDGDKYGYSPVGRIFLNAWRKIDKASKYNIRTYKSHTSIWGDSVNSLEKISNSEVRMIFKRIFDSCQGVTAIFLDEFNKIPCQELHLEYIETISGALRYRLYSPEGMQYIKVELVPGYESKALQMLGRKIYP